jgi:hypothetical protein
MKRRVSLTASVLHGFDVLIDDQVNGIYTDPASSTKLSSTRPAGGPQMVNYSLTLNEGQKGVFSSRTYLPTAMRIDSGSALPNVSLIADLIHTVFVTVGSRSMSFFIDVPNPAVQIIPSLSGAGRVEFYTSSGTALSVKMGGPRTPRGLAFGCSTRRRRSRPTSFLPWSARAPHNR